MEKEPYDWKAKSEELFSQNIKLRIENEKLKRDIRWIKSVLAYALEGSHPIVVREEELQHAPEIVLDENMANEIIVRVRRSRNEKKPY